MIVLCLTMFLVVASAARAVTRIPHRCDQRPARLLCATHFHKDRANQARARIGLHALPYHWRAEAHPSLRPRILTYWVRVHAHSLRRLHAARAVPWSASWYHAALCVHHYEGAWNANTGNGYYGGMQFSLSTWQSAGGTGRPDLASPSEQLRVAYHLWQAAGWGPWPNTARYCGLLG